MRLSKEAGHHRDGDRQPRGDPATIPVVSGGPQAGSDPGLRIPLADFAALHEASPGPDCDDATQVVRELRMVKSECEIARLAHVCSVVADAF